MSVRNKEAADFWHSIPCVPGCGGCCPVDCDRLNKVKRICKVHPGPERTLREAWLYYNFGSGCDSSPFELFTWGYGCPPIVIIMEKLLGETIFTCYPEPSQVVWMTDANKILDKTRRLMGLFENKQEARIWPPKETGMTLEDAYNIRDEVMGWLTPVLVQGVHTWRE